MTHTSSQTSSQMIKREQFISAQVSCSNLFDWYIILSLEIYSNLGYTPLSKVLSEQCILNFTFMCLLLCSLKEHPLLDSYRGIYKKSWKQFGQSKDKEGPFVLLAFEVLSRVCQTVKPVWTYR